MFIGSYIEDLFRVEGIRIEKPFAQAFHMRIFGSSCAFAGRNKRISLIVLAIKADSADLVLIHLLNSLSLSISPGFSISLSYFWFFVLFFIFYDKLDKLIMSFTYFNLIFL